MIRRLVISAIAAGALVALGLSFNSSKPPKKTVALPTAVRAVSPAPGDLDLRQMQLSVELAPGFTGVLYLDEREIPEDDLHRVPALNSVALQPQSDSDFKQLAPGSHRATVLYWPLGEPRERAQSYTWTFSLH